MGRFYIPAAVILGLSNFGSRFLGVFRDHLLTRTFGATRDVPGVISELDVYYAAFRLPDFLFNLLILGTVSSVFIPVFAGMLKSNKEQAWNIAASVMNLVLLVMCFMSGILWFFVDSLMPYFTYGFDEAALQETIRLTRMMLLTPIFFGLASVTTSVLNSFHRFVAMSFSPVVYNAGIIFGIFFLEPRFGISGVTLGVVFGSFLHLAILIPSLFKVGFRPQLSLNLSHPKLRKMGSLAIPRMISLSASQINLIVTTALASGYSVGSVAILNLAINIQSLPVGIIGLSVAIATFATLAEIASSGNLDRFADRISTTTRMILFLMIPTTAVMIQLRAELVRLVFGSGSFNWTDTVITADAMGYLAISLFALALLPLYSRAFYALEDTRTPLYVTLFSVVLNTSLAYLLGSHLSMGVHGLTLAISLSTIFHVSFLYLTLNERLEGRLHSLQQAMSIVKASVATLCMMMSLQFGKFLIGGSVSMDTFLGVLLKTLGSLTLGGITFLVVAHILGCTEIREVLKKFRR